MKVYYDKDADLSLVKGKKVSIIGYGSQGHAHAQNLNDSGVKVTVGVRKSGPSWEKVKKAGLKGAEIPEAVKNADFVMMLMPDEHIAATYKSEVEPNIKEGATLAFAHGFNIHYHQVAPRKDLDVVMIAPKAPGHTVRSTYVQGGGVPMLIATGSYWLVAESVHLGQLEATPLESSHNDSAACGAQVDGHIAAG